MIRRTILFFAVILVPFILKAGEGYKITIKVTGMEDTTAYLANYYGNKVYMADTALTNNKGVCVFEGEEALPTGLYIFAVNNSKVFEFVIAEKQVFALETSGPAYVENMTVKGSVENEIFYNNMAFNSRKFKEVEPLRKDLKRLGKDSDSSKIIKDQISVINDEVVDFKLKLIEDNTGTFMSVFLNSLMEVEVPDPPDDVSDSIGKIIQYNYYKDHYWDNIDLGNDGLIRTPIVHPKIDDFFDKVVIQHPDSLIKECDRIIEFARPGKEMFKYFVWYLTRKYETSKIMGFDAVFVHLVDSYYATNQTYWTNPTVLKNITERASQLRPILLGKKAPNLIMLDTNERPVTLHSIDAKYILIFFWDTECGHCKKETPVLKKFYDENKDEIGLEVFAVCTDTSYNKMKDYIRSKNLTWINVNGPRAYTKNYHDLYDVYSTPVFYLLDEDKNIIAKRLLTEHLSDFIEKHEEFMANKRKNSAVIEEDE